MCRDFKILCFIGMFLENLGGVFEHPPKSVIFVLLSLLPKLASQAA